ncbi:hypothetical protein ZIOFF_072438 [Zingiber officinale]|uniref:Uncharacterized protein n=1 Tax=Zingiber officinale TaxID=94328 RepID=A0A8J5BAN7_ZINOF|nr:hypothetical protein ZIOFF_072438 [Zingiber officinale]
MATNVFGNPVTDETVRLVSPNITQITARDRARVALQYMNAEEKATNVSRFVHNLKEAYGTGTSTLGMIYNATGGNLTFDLNHTWEGAVWHSPYPQIIQNGQWAGFLHVRDRLIGPSKEAIVYRGVYAEIGTAGGFGSANWNAIDSKMDSQTNNYSTTALGGFASASIGAGSSPEFVGIMSLDDLGSNFMAMASDVSVVSQSLDSKYVDDVDGADEEPPAE